MIRPQFTLDLNAEKIGDNFAGGGGASTGIEQGLGRCVDDAVNHNVEALGMHRINHPQTIHHCEDVFDVDPAVLAEGRRYGMAWFSPDCKHFSKAKGGKPVDKKIRGLVLVMLRWAKIRTRVMFMENVEEIKTWGPLLPNGKPDPAHKGRTWHAFLAAISTGLAPNHPDMPEILEVLGDSVTKDELVRGFGYKYSFREIRACDYGAPTIRKRLFAIFRCDEKPIVWPEPTHAAPELANGRLKPYRTIAECIQWDLPCRSIFLSAAEARQYRCRRPLKRNTLQRVANGMDRYVLKAKRPVIVSLTHQGGDRTEPIDEPAKTVTGAHRGEKGLVDATLAPFVTEHANASTQRTFPPDEPMRTQCAQVKGGHFALVSAGLVHTAHGEQDKRGRKRGRGSLPVTEPMPSVLASQDCALFAATIVGAGGRAAQSRPRGADETLHTVTAKGDTVLAAANLVKMRGDPASHPSQPADEPGHTISAGGTHLGVSMAYLTAYFGNDEVIGQMPDTPARTLTAKPRHNLVEAEGQPSPLTPEQLAGARRVAKFLREYGVEFEGELATVGPYVIVDIGIRMLTPRELFRAQGFPESYVIDRAWLINPKNGDLTEVALTKEQQIRMCGNSVSPPVAKALVAANVPEMATWYKSETRRKKTPAPWKHGLSECQN